MERSPALQVVGLATLACSTGLCSPAAAATTDTTSSTLGLVLGRVPQLLTGSVQGWPISGGFSLNIVMSIAAMAIGTIVGLAMFLGLASRSPIIRVATRLTTNFFRNAPWLVLLFSTLYLLPFTIHIGRWSIALPPAAKAIAGLSLPIGANLAEIIRGAVQSIHSGQWESARALGYSTLQCYRHVILPQALRRMLPSYMSLYASVVIGTSLASVVGVDEVLTVLRNILATQNETVIVAFYGAVFLIFFLFCYPISIFARRMERRLSGDAL
jgi:polar amino acid transport system permease protein